jgi:hypothetical protein
MADVLREKYELSALRFSMQFEKSEPFVQIRAYHGREELAVQSIPAAEVGIGERLSVRAYRGAQFRLPQQVIQRLAGALPGRDIDDPVWLQIDRSAGFLAVVPWERLLAIAMPGPFLRIPNFLVDPVSIIGQLELVICASAPAAKEFYPVADFTRSLVGSIQQSVLQGTDIHIFADREAFRSLQSWFSPEVEAPLHRVTVHDPDRAAQFGTGESEISESERLRSPWLRWIEKELGGDRTIDAVHFICPGYFNSEHGSLALARSPLDNKDGAWSHFVGGPELRTLLDELGAGAVAFWNPGEEIWALGLRLLADELAWTRPGPVILHEGRSLPDAVGRAYRFLFGKTSESPPGRGELLIYCHPRLLKHVADAPHFETPTLSTEELGHEWLQAAREEVATTAATSAGPRWARTNRLLIEQSLLDLSRQHGEFAKGGAKALKFLSRLQLEYLKEPK